MKWEKVGKIGYQTLFWMIEWGFKLCAVVAGSITLATKGTFGMKLGTGFGALSDGLRKLFSFFERFNEISWVVQEYHQIGSAEFQELHGLAPVDRLIALLNGFFVFLHQTLTNLLQQPISSITATVLVFGSFYLLARIIRFARQKGRKSWLCRFELRLGKKVFSKDLARSKPKESNIAKNSQNSLGQSIKEFFPKLT